MILNETVAAIADAIREKTGKSELIKPVDFATEIKGITAGGSGESASTIEYLDGTKLAETGHQDLFLEYALYHKILVDREDGYRLSGVNAYAVGPTLGADFLIPAVAIDFSQEVRMGDMLGHSASMTLKEFMFMSGVTQTELDAIPRITKEEFYDLNA